MLYEATAIFTAGIGIMTGALGFAVVIARVKAAKIGDAASEAMMQRAIRAHGNLTEYAPIFLIILLIAENASIQPIWLYLMGATFVLGRLVLITYFWVNQIFALRVLAFWATVLPIFAGALLLLFNVT